MLDAIETLVAELKKRQGNLSDVEFAKLLSVKRTTLIPYLSSSRPLRPPILLSAIARTFPDMDPQILAFLRREQT